MSKRSKNLWKNRIKRHKVFLLGYSESNNKKVKLVHRMKIGFFNKRLLGNFLKWVSSISVVFTTVLAFFDLCPKVKLIVFGCFLGTLLLIYAILLIMANVMTRLKLKINNSIVNIRFDDIFNQPESDLKVIAFNEYFDTKVDDVIISKNTLNGKYLLQLEQPIEELDELIANSTYMQDRIAGKNSKRKAGKIVRYKLGTIYKNKDYLLVALTHFDENNRAQLTLQQYSDCLINMWNEIDNLYNGQTVTLPLLGSGITRFKDCRDITDQELLEIILWTYRISKVKFTYPSCLNIVLDERKKDKLNLYKLKGE